MTYLKNVAVVLLFVSVGIFIGCDEGLNQPVGPTDSEIYVLYDQEVSLEKESSGKIKRPILKEVIIPMPASGECPPAFQPVNDEWCVLTQK